MQSELALRRFPTNSFVAMLAVLLALIGGGVSGYWLKSLQPSTPVNSAQAAAVVAPARQMAPPHDLPEESASVADAVDRALAGAANVTDAVDRALARAINPSNRPSSRTGD